MYKLILQELLFKLGQGIVFGIGLMFTVYGVSAFFLWIVTKTDFVEWVEGML